MTDPKTESPGGLVRETLILAVVMVFVLAGSVWASTAGWGLPQPEKEPVSLREGSVHGPLGRGVVSTRYFVGGGLHDGK